MKPVFFSVVIDHLNAYDKILKTQTEQWLKRERERERESKTKNISGRK